MFVSRAADGSALDASLRPKIVLVEDEFIIAAALKMELTKSGYHVVGVASTADQALAAIKENTPALVLMDIRIKGPIDGIQTAQQIHGVFNIPVIFMSAHGDAKTLDRARDAGASGYLVKPIAPGVLLAAVEAVLRRHPATPTKP
jgi:DNA-binding response OmpR family regulator